MAQKTKNQNNKQKLIVEYYGQKIKNVLIIVKDIMIVLAVIAIFGLLVYSLFSPYDWTRIFAKVAVFAILAGLVAYGLYWVGIRIYWNIKDSIKSCNEYVKNNLGCSEKEGES